jgi:hypothetical protein
MAASVTVNEITVVHAGSDGEAISAGPDTCLTPGPSGPTPMAYVNTASSRDLARGTHDVECDGHPIAVEGSEFAISTGDEAGTAGGGVFSGVIKGKAKFTNYSFDVFAEGQSVCRLGDPMTMNGNAPNTSTPAEMQPNVPGVAGDRMNILCKIFCWCDAGNSGSGFIRKVPFDPRIA